MNLNLNLSRGIIVLILVLNSVGITAQEINESLPSFSRFKASNGINVEMIPSDQHKIEIEGYDKDEVKYEVKGNQLDVRLSWDNVFSDSNTWVRVYFVSLDEIEANSKATVELLDEYEGNTMVMSAGEGANLIARLKANRVSIKVTTGGHLQLFGETDRQEGKVNTGGVYNGRDFESKDAEFSVATGGVANIYAAEQCRVEAKLGGSIQVYGNPERLDQKTSFGGSISINE